MRMYAVVTGNIRSPEYTRLVIDYLGMKMDSGKIDGLIFSTWDGEIDKLPGLRKSLQEMGAILVESQEPRIVQKNVTSSYTSSIFQYTAMYNASLVIPDDVIVLKTRTDRCMETNVKIFRYLERVNNLEEIADYFSVFQYSTRIPFCFEDITFITGVRGFREILDFGIQNFIIERNPAAQVSFFGSDIKLVDPIVSLTLDCFSFPKFRKMKRAEVEDILSNRIVLSSLVRFYWRYFNLVKERFIDVESNKIIGERLPPISSIMGIGERAFQYRGFDPFEECLCETEIDELIFGIVEEIKDEGNDAHRVIEHINGLQVGFAESDIFKTSLKIDSLSSPHNELSSHLSLEANRAIIRELESSRDSSRLNKIIQNEAKSLIGKSRIEEAWTVLKTGIFDGDFGSLELAVEMHLLGKISGKREELEEFCRYFNKSGTADKSRKLLQTLSRDC